MFRKTLARSCAAILGAMALGAASQAAAEPAIWVIKDADSTIYLFGSVHMLKSDVVWESAKLKAALKDATEVWFEVPDPSDQQKTVAEVLPTLLSKGMSPETPLSSRLAPEDYAKVETAAKTAGIDIRAVNIMRPWLAAVLLSAAPATKSGFDPQVGVERVLEKEARAQGDSIKGFETLSQQLSFFADLPDAVQLDYLKSVLGAGDSSGDIDKLTAAWVKGDLKALEKGVVGETKKESPALYAALIAGRNKAWAEQIAERLKGTGVSFMAVGAGHLVGPDSLQAELKKKGIVARRF